MDRILVHEPAFNGIRAALREFIGTVNCRLIVTLGHHDPELALPWVSEELVRALPDTWQRPK